MQGNGVPEAHTFQLLCFKQTETCCNILQCKEAASCLPLWSDSYACTTV